MSGSCRLNSCWTAAVERNAHGAIAVDATKLPDGATTTFQIVGDGKLLWATRAR